MLVLSVANALGVTPHDAQRALSYCGWDLEKAVSLLTELLTE